MRPGDLFTVKLNGDHNDILYTNTLRITSLYLYEFTFYKCVYINKYSAHDSGYAETFHPKLGLLFFIRPYILLTSGYFTPLALGCFFFPSMKLWISFSLFAIDKDRKTAENKRGV